MATGDLAGRSFAIVEDTGVAGMTTQIHNSGTLAGEVYLGNLADSLRNSGEVLGAVDMGLDADVVFNSDLIVGNVDLGDGADRYKGLGGGLVDGIVRSGARADTLTGGDGPTNCPAVPAATCWTAAKGRIRSSSRRSQTRAWVRPATGSVTSTRVKT
jgi:hypothetical protein